MIIFQFRRVQPHDTTVQGHGANSEEKKKEKKATWKTPIKATHANDNKAELKKNKTESTNCALLEFEHSN